LLDDLLDDLLDELLVDDARPPPLLVPEYRGDVPAQESIASENVSISSIRIIYFSIPVSLVKYTIEVHYVGISLRSDITKL